MAGGGLWGGSGGGKCRVREIRWHHDWTRGLPTPMDGTARQVHSKSWENQWNLQEPRRTTGALQCTTAGPHNAIPTDLLRAASACGLGIDLFGIRIFGLAAW